MKKLLSFDILYVFIVLSCTISAYFITQSQDIHTSVEFYKKNYRILYMFIYAVVLCGLPLAELLTNINKLHLPIHRRVLLVSFALTLFCSIISFRSGLYFSVFFYASTIYCYMVERKMYKPFTVNILFISYFLLNIVSLLWVNSVNFEQYKNIRVYDPFLFFSISFFFVKFQRDEIHIIMRAFYRFTILFVCFSIICWMHEAAVLHIPLHDWFVSQKTYFNGSLPYTTIYKWTYYNHPTFTSVGYTIGFAAGLVLTNKIKKRNYAEIFILFLSLLSVIFLNFIDESRLGVTTIVILTIMSVGYLIRERKRLFYIYTVLASIGCILFVSVYYLKIYGFIYDPERKQLYEMAFYSIQQHPLAGTGLGAIRDVLSSSDIASKLGYPLPLIGLGNPHNQFVGDLMQTGIIGLTLVISIIGYLFYNSVKNRNFMLFLFLIIYSLLMLIEMPLAVHIGVILFLPFCFLFLQLGQEPQEVNHCK